MTRDPLTKEEREFLSTHDKGEFAYSAESRAMLDGCCHRGLLAVVEGEFIQEVVDGPGRVRLRAIYRLTQRASDGLAWVAEGAAP